MIYLLFSIICSASIAIIFKYSELKHYNRNAVTLYNYVTASIVSVSMIIIKNNQYKKIEYQPFNNEFINVVVKNAGIFSPWSSIIWACILGVFTGVLYYTNFILYQKSIKDNGASISGTFSRIGFLIPMFVSIFIWHEYPQSVQWIGIIISIIAVILINYNGKGNTTKSGVLLIILFICSGCGDLTNKLFQKYADIAYKDMFLACIFITALLISLYITIKSRHAFNIKELIIGFLVGVPNLFSSFFMIMALNKIKASVAFPVYSAGTIIAINAAGYFIFKESLSLKEKICVMLTIIAIIVVNI